MFKKLFLLLLVAPLFLFCQSKKTDDFITGKFSPPENFDFVIIYRLNPSGKSYVKDTKIDKNSQFEIKTDSTLQQGNYRLVYSLPEDANNFDFIYDGEEAVSFNFSQGSGAVFTDIQNRLLSTYLNEMDAVKKDISAELDSENPNKSKLEKLFLKQSEIQEKAEEKTQNSFVAKFIKANTPFIPIKFKTRSIYYGSKKSEFFKHFNFEDEQLQSSNFPLKKIKEYYEDFVTKQGGSFYRSIINDIHFEIRNSELGFQKKILAEFWEFLVENNKKNAANYLSETYLSELSSRLNDDQLTSKLNVFRNLTIGATPPDFNWTDKNNNIQTLYGTTGASYFVLAFWSTGCSHCMEQMPVLHEKMLQMDDSKIKVIAIGLENDDNPWETTITNFPQFINVLKVDQDRINLSLNYDITATPTFFVLDKDKKIIGKPRGEKNLSDMIDKLDKYKQ